MKKITKLLLMTAIAIGMVACSNDDNLPDAPDANAAKGNTYASISIKLPKGPSTRALPEDYNNKGTWEGIDEIETITVFLVNTEGDPTVDFESFTKDSFDGIDSQGILFPNVALKATAGEKVKAYVVLNGDDSDILADLKAPTTTAANFDAKYNAVISEVASKLAKNNGTNDIIMMTNTVAPVEKEVKAGVSEGDAMAGSVNTFMVDVERVVSRAIVTAKSTAKEAEIKVLDALGGEASTITIKDLKYVVGQSNNQFYMIKQDGYKTPDAVYNHVPSVDTWKPALFDNTGLANSTEVKTAAGTALADFKTALTTELGDSKFVLPVTHADANYEKGNTTYFEVTAIFTPDKVDGGDYTAGADVFLGMKDGLFYSTRALAEASGQKATHYKGDKSTGAIMKYVLWLNPDKVPGAAAGEKATMSPTVRNQVYHAHITGFKQIGLPNNPLNPTDPNNPQVDPKDPTKPMDPTDPGYDPNNPGNENPINPIKPEDPLQTEDTYLSVQITVRPWGIHSYEINLGNDY